MRETAATLWKQGGVRRFYRGVSIALVEGPIGRGVGAGANYATLNMLESVESRTGHTEMSLFTKTAISSIGVGMFRLLYYPLDTVKTVLQVEGAQGISILKAKMAKHGGSVLYHGAVPYITGAAIRHTAWFSVYNYLDNAFPETTTDYDGARALNPILRNAAIGSACAIVTDVVSNPISALKAYRQTSASSISYPEAVRTILLDKGIVNLLTRGLSTRIWVDVLNSAVFTVIWRYLATHHANGTSREDE